MSKEEEWVEERESQRKPKVGDWVHIAKVGINGAYKVIEIIGELYLCEQNDDGYKHKLKVTEKEIIKL